LFAAGQEGLTDRFYSSWNVEMALSDPLNYPYSKPTELPRGAPLGAAAFIVREGEGISDHQ
jgi:hypothetical protein